MVKKFAFFEFTVASVPAYTTGNNPFTLENVNIAGESGYKVKLPLTETEAETDAVYTAKLVEKAVDELRNHEVGIILPPRNVKLPPGKTIPVASGALLFPFFLVQCVKRIYKKRNGSGDIGYVNALTAGLPSKLLEVTVRCLVKEFNYVNIALHEHLKLSEKESVAKLTDDLLYETGVAVGVTESGRYAYANSDVIINLLPSADRYEYVYRENAIFADLSGNEDRINDIARRRPDVVAFNGVRLRLGSGYGGGALSLPVFELFYYVKSMDYRRLAASSELDGPVFERVYASLASMGIQSAVLCKNGRVVNVGRR